MKVKIQLLRGPLDGMWVFINGDSLFLEIQMSHADGEHHKTVIYRMTDDPMRYVYIGDKDE